MSKEVNEERTPRTVEDVKEMLVKYSNGEIQRTIQNCIMILQNDHVLADAIRLNLLSERIDIVKPVGWPRSSKTLNDTDMKYILRRMEKYGISSEKKIEAAVRIVANENRYHPIRDYLNGLKWDGTERIAHVLHHFLGAAEDEYTCEAMKIFLLVAIKLAFSPAMQETLQAHQQDFMQEDAQAGMIYAFLEDYSGDRVCSKQLYAEALGNTNIPAEWETCAICEIMNTGIARGDIKGWQAHKTAKRYPKYGVQKGWERVTSPETGVEDFSEITDVEAKQIGFPF